MPTLTLTNTTSLDVRVTDLPGGVRLVSPLSALLIDFLDDIDPDFPSTPTRRDIHNALLLRELIDDGILTASPPITEFDTEGEVVGGGDPTVTKTNVSCTATGSVNNWDANFFVDDGTFGDGGGLAISRTVWMYVSADAAGIGLHSIENLTITAGGGTKDAVLDAAVANKLFLVDLASGADAGLHAKIDVVGNGSVSDTAYVVMVNPTDGSKHIQPVVLTPSE